jgi:hypothetical protein
MADVMFATPAQVRRRDLVVAAAAGIGVHVLPVRRDHDRDEERDPGGGVPGEVQHRQPAGRQHQQDLLGGVRH